MFFRQKYIKMSVNTIFKNVSPFADNHFHFLSRKNIRIIKKFTTKTKQKKIRLLNVSMSYFFGVLQTAVGTYEQHTPATAINLAVENRG